MKGYNDYEQGVELVCRIKIVGFALIRSIGDVILCQLFDGSKDGVRTAAHRFLDCCSWVGTTVYQQELHSHWTEHFTEKAGFPDDAVQNFIAFVDEMSYSAESYVSMMSSNGCADQLTNWDGSKKQGLAAPEKKKGGGMSR